MNDMTRQTIFHMIDTERNNQLDKWGHQHHTMDKWNTILIEEIGEISKTINDKDVNELHVELIQSAAVIVAWLEDYQEKSKLHYSQSKDTEYIDNDYDIELYEQWVNDRINK